MKNFSPRKLVTIALLIAVSVILRLLGFPQTGTIRFEAGFLPIAAVAYMYGGVWSGVAYVIADIIGTLFTGAPPFPPITLCKLVFGFIFGLFFYRKKLTKLRIFLCVLTITLVVDLGAMPLALFPLYPGKGIWVIMTNRLLMSVVNLPFRTLTIILMFKYLGGYFDRYLHKNFTGYANSFQAVARLRLESITCLLDILGNPHDKLKCIHIAGTNGKGSVCVFLQGILTLSGRKTGRYISPEMLNVRERISIDGEIISENQLDEVMTEVRAAAEQARKKLGELPTQFELWTAAAFLYFLRQGCDICVIETGLGGTRDATNVIPTPLFSIITRIAMDHMNYLGNTLYEIATQKAGIIKDGCPVITLHQNEEAERAIREGCLKHNSPCTFVKLPAIDSHSDCHEQFSYGEIKSITLGICGVHQPENAALAIEAAMALGIDSETIKKGLAAARNPGRFEQLGSHFIFDGAHNRSGIDAMTDSLERYFPNKKKTFICGFMGDKDLDSVFAALEGYKNEKFYTITVQNNPRAIKSTDLCRVARSHGFDAVSLKDVNEAIKKAANDELVIICGSLYTYKDIDFSLIK